MKRHALRVAALMAVLLLAATLRLYNTSWDGGYYLHPDERFLTMVGTAITIPGSLGEYLDPAVSTVNPNNLNYSFFVYGTFPLILNKFLAIWTVNDHYAAYGQLGRVFSGALDVITVLLVYKIASLLARKHNVPGEFPLIAAFFYTIAVLPIQLSHFFTSDMFLTFFMVLAVYSALQFAYSRRVWLLLLAGLAFGLAVASKISGVYVAPLLGLLIYLATLDTCPLKAKKDYWKAILQRSFELRALRLTVSYGVMFSVVALITIRLAAPYYFETASVFNVTPSTLFVSNLEQLKSFDSREGYFPPAIQWMSKPPWFSLQNTVVFGLGVPYALLVGIGLYLVVRRYRSLAFWAIAAWCVGYFTYQSFLFVKVMRYTIFLYPVFALLAALATVHVLKDRPRWLYGVVALTVLVWPLMFFNIYTKPHTRVEASEWIHKNLPSGSLILSEHWDDGLPLLIPGTTKMFPGEQLEVFYPDSPEKFAKIEEQMARADYYILSSNRAWGSIQSAPDKYPQMAQWYPALFRGEKGYTIIHEITRYPSLEWLGIPLTLPDDWADEAFSVYDHPRVIIMENTAKRLRQ